MDSYIAAIIAASVFGTLYLALRATQSHQAHQERMAALERGQEIKPILVGAGMAPAFGHRLYLVRGMVWIAVGLALGGIIATILPVLEARDPRAALEIELVRANTLKNLGANEAQIAAMEAEIKRQTGASPDKMVLCSVGFLPIAVGIAYLLFYRMEERRTREQQPPPAA